MLYSAQRPPAFTLSAGPVDAYPEVLRAMGRTVLYDFDPAFLAFYQRVAEKAQKAMGTKSVPLILHGEPVLALEAAAASLIGSDDVVLNLASGVYGKGFGYWAARYAREVVEIEVPYNECVTPEAVEAFLAGRPDVTILSVCHHDTPSGTLNDIDAIGAICAKRGVLTIIDAVSSFGGMDVSAERAQAGILVTGPNKCLGCPPGLSMVAVSDAAWAKMKANPAAPTASMLSMLDWEEAWRADRPFPFTPSVSEINGLDAALDLYLEEGPEAVWRRHALTAAACRAGIRGLGIEIWAARDEIASPTCTAVKVPEGVDGAALLAQVRARYGVMLSSGRAETMGKLLRIGHMGPTAQPMQAVLAVAALGGTLNAMGHTATTGAGVEAAMAVIDAAQG